MALEHEFLNLNLGLVKENAAIVKKENSFDKGKMKDYWLVIYDGSYLKV